MIKIFALVLLVGWFCLERVLKKDFSKYYAYVFGKKIFLRYNRFLYQLSLCGMGILNYQNPYLFGEKGWLKNYLANKEKPTILDVGANRGEYSRAILTITPRARILAFEPHPITFNVLKKAIHFEGFTAYNLGVGDKHEKLEIYDYDNKDGSAHASLYKEVIEDLHKGTAISHTVQVVALDEFLKEKEIDTVDLLKIDTEGHELSALMGAKSYLSNNKVKAIHFEFNEMNIISKVRFKDFWDMLPNYDFYRLLPGGGRVPIRHYTPHLL